MWCAFSVDVAVILLIGDEMHHVKIDDVTCCSEESCRTFCVTTFSQLLHHLAGVTKQIVNCLGRVRIEH